MIKISIDEGSAFDVLSIFQIKIKLSDTKEKQIQNKKNFLSLKKELCEQIGKKLVKKILYSITYKKLCKANEDTFIAVSKAKTDEVTASCVDRCNYQRYIIKKKVQSEFFNSKLTETKTGYEKLK